MSTEDNEADRIKIGFYEQKDGKYTAFLQMQNLPDKNSAVEAAEWLADIMTSLTKPPDQEEH